MNKVRILFLNHKDKFIEVFNPNEDINILIDNVVSNDSMLIDELNDIEYWSGIKISIEKSDNMDHEFDIDIYGDNGIIRLYTIIKTF